MLRITAACDKPTDGKLDQDLKTKFHVGNGCTSDDPEEAAEKLGERGFPNAGNENAEPLFIPDFFTLTKSICLTPRLAKGTWKTEAGANEPYDWGIHDEGII